MADKYGSALIRQQNSDFNRKRTSYQKYKRDLALEAIDKEFQKQQDELSSNYIKERKELEQNYHNAGVDRQAQKQAKEALDQADKAYKSQSKAITNARSRARWDAGELSQYNGTTKEIEAYAKKLADEEAQKSQARNQAVDNVKNEVKDRAKDVTGSLGGYFNKRFGKGDDEETTGYGVSLNPQQQEDYFGLPGVEKKPFEGGLMDPSLNRNKALGEFTDKQKEERAKAEEDKKKKEEADNAEWQKKNGGSAFDRSRMTIEEDEDGNSKWGARKETGDLTYHPALEAIKSMKPEDDNDGGGIYADIWGLGNYFRKRLHADDKDPMNRSGHLRRQAEMHDIEAGDHQRSMQSNNQIANRDYRSEAEKNAASQAAAENAQKVHNLGNAGAGAAALERDVKAADYNTMMQRSDQQRSEGVKNMEKMHDDRQVAEEERSGADVYDYTARDMNDYNARSNWLSMGKPSFGIGAKKERPEKIPDVEERQTDYPPQTDEGESAVDTAAAQDVINEFVGASLNDELNGHKELDSGGQELFASMSEKYPSLKPIPSWPTSTRENYYKNLGVDVSMSNKDPNKWMKATNAWSNSDDEYGSSKDKKALLGELQVQRSETGDASETRAEGQGGTFARRNIDEGQLGDVVKPGQEQQ